MSSGEAGRDADSLIKEAKAYLGQRQFDRADEAATRAIGLDPKRAAAYVVRAEARRKLGRSDQALADLAVSIRLDPDRASAYVVRAEILKKRCLFDQAIADATHALFLDPNNAAAYSIRSDCRRAIGDLEGAAEDVQELVRIDPTRPVGPQVIDTPRQHEEGMSTDERFYKAAATDRPELRGDIFADGKPADRSMKSRVIDDPEEAADLLAQASGYKPGVITRPIPRHRSDRGRPDRQASWALLILVGAALFGGGLFWARRDRPKEESPEKIEAVGTAAVVAGPANRPEPVAGPAVSDRPTAALTLVPSPVKEPSAPTGLREAARPPSGDRHPDYKGLGGWQTTEPVEVMNWVSQDGVLTYAAQGPSLMTSERYGDFELRLEFLLPPKCNSGVYLRGRYEVQLIDPTFVLPNGKRLSPEQNNGGIYGLIPPRQVVYSGPNRWNTLDVRMVGRNVSVRLNGVLVVDNKRVDRPTAGAFDTNEGEPGPIVLQGHAVTGSRFRNISITSLPAVTTTRGRPGSGPTSSAVLAPAGQDNAPISPLRAGNSSATATTVPEVISLTELNTAKRDFCPWLSPDGLTIYWVTDTPSDPEGEVWSARRKDPGSLFANKRQVGYGRHISVSADGLTMFLVARRADGSSGFSIQVVGRQSTDEAFGRPQEVPELRSIDSPRNLSLSADGRTLMFCDGPFTTEGFRLMMTARDSPNSRWGQPRPVRVAMGRGEGLMTGPHLTADGLTLLCSLEKPNDQPVGRIMVCSRNTLNEPFSKPVFLTLPEVKDVFGWMPRYTEATHELFFCSNRLSSGGNLDLWVVRNFKIPRPD